MEMTKRPVGDVAVIELSGKLDGVSEVNDAIALAEPSRKILLDFHGVRKVTDTAIRQLAYVAQQLRDRGGDIKALNVKIRDVTMKTQLAVTLEIHDDEAAAIRSFP